MRAATLAIALIFSAPVQARDDGRYAESPLRSWFDQLASGRGRCCSYADGVSVADVDWDVQGNSYLVRVCAVPPGLGETWENCKDKAWVVVPDNALVTGPNKFGPAIVWPYSAHTVQGSSTTQIRCFMPAAMS
jgi:hypothetical protein